MRSDCELNECSKIGQLARYAKVSVKTLHHYHQIGLLVPSHETPSGHRLYAPKDFECLQQIRALRQAGFPLPQIKQLLHKKNSDWKQTAQQHREFLNEESKRLRKQTEWITIAIQIMHQTQQERSFGQAVLSAQLLSKYFSARQLLALSLQLEDRGTTWLAQWKSKLKENLQAIDREQRGGTPVRTATIGKLLQERKHTFEELTKGSRSIACGFRRMYLGEAKLRSQRGINPRLHDFIERALKVHRLVDS